MAKTTETSKMARSAAQERKDKITIKAIEGVANEVYSSIMKGTNRT